VGWGPKLTKTEWVGDSFGPQLIQAGQDLDAVKGPIIPRLGDDAVLRWLNQTKRIGAQHSLTSLELMSDGGGPWGRKVSVEE
jgi:hypothetical protein